MKRFYKKSLYKIFVSLFVIFYSFVPPVISINQLVGLSDNGRLFATAQEADPVVTEPITRIGMCLEEAAGETLNCTANDVSISRVTGIEILDDGCDFPGDTVTFRADWEVQSTANERYDIGLYFATEGQSEALIGECSVSTLPNFPVPPYYNYDKDYCGDLDSSSPVSAQIELTAVCLDPDGDNYLNLPYCTSWDNQSANICTGPADAIPNTKSKCNCPIGGFTVPITVPYSASIEVIKEIEPSTDTGVFDLYVDDRSTNSCVGDGGTTGKLTVSAGTSVTPGDTHIVGESVEGCGTDLSNYDSTISCVDRGLSTFNGEAPLILNGVGPLSVNVEKDDDIVCTITNTKKTGSIMVNKFLDSDANGSFETENPTSFEWILDGDEVNTYSMGSTKGSVLIGQHEISETQLTNHSFVGWYPNIVGAGFTCENLPEGEEYRELPIGVEVTDSEVTEITLCNAADPGTLTVKKVTDPVGDSTEFNILARSTDTGVILEDPEGVISFGNDYVYSVSVGTYAVNEENIPSGWYLSAKTCVGIYVGPGENKTCTFYNTKYGSISGYKFNDLDGSNDTINDRYGLGGWTITLYEEVDGQYQLTGRSMVTLSNGYYEFENLKPGNYMLKESLTSFPSWYPIDPLSAEIYVTVDAGDNLTDQNFVNVEHPTITIYKNVDGNGDGDLDDDVDIVGTTDWKWNIDGSGNYNTGTLIERNPGTYRVSEVQMSHYHVASLVCNNGETYSASESFDVTLVSGQDLECTFTNSRNLGTLIVKKFVVNDNGGTLGAEDFYFQIDRGDPIQFEADGQNEFIKYAGYSYSITEPSVTGYETSYDNCNSVFVPYGETVTCTITNNDVAPKLTVIKEVTNDNGGNALPDDFDLTVGGTEVLSGSEHTYSSNTPYAINETQLSGYTFTSITGDEKCPEVLGGTVTLDEGDDITCTITNDDVAPTVELLKSVVNRYGGEATPASFDLFIGGTGVTSGQTLAVMSNTSIAISEEPLSGYEFVSITGDEKCPEVLGGTVTLDEGENITCTITNQDQPGTILIMKNVLGVMGEDVYSNDSFEVVLADELNPSQLIRDSELNPLTATFGLLSAGYYTPYETNLPDGYQFNGCYPLIAEVSEFDQLLQNHVAGTYLGNGETLTFICENQVIQPELEISKNNYSDPTGEYAGDYVEYRILVRTPVRDGEDIDDYVVKDVKVRDITPAGFVYQIGSWSAVSSLRGDLKLAGITTEPVYNGVPAVWNLGDMLEDETVELRYTVKISLLQDTGLYKDIAWTSGESILGAQVLGNDDSGVFVGTKVLVVEDPGIEEGEVLGTSIELPRTGAETYITLGALLAMVLGFILLVFNPKRRIKNLVIAGILLLGVFGLVKPTPTYASTPNINVQIEQPESPTKSNNFNIGFVALDLLGREISIQCYKDAGIPFGPVYNSNSGNCVVDSSIISASGTYHFYVEASAGGESIHSEIVAVVVDLEKPLPVINYVKTDGTCSYTLTFKTANDGRTSKVQIFRSSVQPFTANASTMIDEISVSPNESVVYVDNPVPNCSTEYFYAVRALDSIGNSSIFTTDNIVKIVYTYTPSTPTEGTTDEAGEIAGEEIAVDGTGGNGEEEEEGDDNGEVKGEEEEEDSENEGDTESFWNKYRYVILAIGVAVLGGVGYIYVRRKK